MNNRFVGFSKNPKKPKKDVVTWVVVEEEYLDENKEDKKEETFLVTASRTGVAKLKSVKSLSFKQKSKDYTKSEWDIFVKDIKENGIKEAITIVVKKNGDAYISEGNYRVKAATELQLKVIPVNVLYTDNSQKKVTSFEESKYE
ncbi:MAG: ParB N-terminal domain-containing protein [bacterium]